jgi:hypothetical protein
MANIDRLKYVQNHGIKYWKVDKIPDRQVSKLRGVGLLLIFCQFCKHVANHDRWPSYKSGQLHRFHCMCFESDTDCTHFVCEMLFTFHCMYFTVSKYGQDNMVPLYNHTFSYLGWIHEMTTKMYLMRKNYGLSN